jgi:hypothetical protein
MREYHWQRILNINSVLILTIDVKRAWAMEPIRELSVPIPLRYQLMKEANRDMTMF